MRKDVNAFKVITGIIAPFFFLVITLAILGNHWNDFEESFLIWLFYLAIIFLIEIYLFSRDYFQKIKKVAYTLIKYVLFSIPIILLLNFAIYLYNTQSIPVENFEITYLKGKNFFISQWRLGEVSIKIKNKSKWDAKNIKVKLNIYFKEDSSLVISVDDELADISFLNSQQEEKYKFYDGFEESSLQHPVNKVYLFEALSSIKKGNYRYRFLTNKEILKLLFLEGLPEEISQTGTIEMSPNDLLELVYQKNRKYYRKLEEKIFFDTDFYYTAEISSASRVTFIDNLIR